MADHIQIGDITPRIQYTGDGVQVAFTYPFPIFADEDIEVFLDETLQVSGYTVSGAGISSGGSITFATAPTSGALVTLVRNVVIERTSDFQESGEFRAKVINDELDKEVAMIQQVNDKVVRSLRLSETDTANDLELPTKAGRAGNLLGFDAEGDPIASVGTSGGVVVSTYMGTVLDDVSASTARTTLGALGSDTSETLTVGMLGQSHDLGTLLVNTTLQIANGNIQHATLGGAITLTAPNDTDEGYLELEFTIDATGGYALTLSGFNEVSGAFDSTANKVNVLRIAKHKTNTYIEITQAV